MNTEFTHVDDFVQILGKFPKEFGDVEYAQWMLMYFRLPAIMNLRFKRFMDPNKLFCTYEGKRYRVVGASRHGDVWLNPNFAVEHGYEKRVNVMDCRGWSASPEEPAPAPSPNATVAA